MKKVLIVFLLFIIVVMILSIIITSDQNHKNNKESKISITYKKDKEIRINNIKKGSVYFNQIIVKNSTNNDLYYSIKWSKINNSVINQNKLLYKLDTHDSDSLYIGDSQVPVADYTLSKKVLIKAKLTHTYEITIKYKDDPTKEKNSRFEGILEIVPNK